MKGKADDEMGEARHVRARTQEQGSGQIRLADTQQHHVVLAVSTQTSTHARDAEAQDQSWRSKLDVGRLSFITYHLSIDTRETRGWGKGLGGVAECQP